MTFFCHPVIPSNPIGNVVNLRLIFVFWASCFSTAIAGETVDTESEALYQNATVLRDAFEKPLQLELLKSGLTPRNAETAARNMLNSLVECWNSDRNVAPGSEQEISIVRLGGQTIVTYKSPCMADFLADVDEVAR